MTSLVRAWYVNSYILSGAMQGQGTMVLPSTSPHLLQTHFPTYRSTLSVSPVPNSPSPSPLHCRQWPFAASLPSFEPFPQPSSTHMLWHL